MKKLSTLLLAAGLVMAASAPASAVDVKMDGYFNFMYDWGKSYNKARGSDDWQKQVTRVGMTFTASEALSAYAQIDAAWYWGVDRTNVVDGLGGLGNYPNARMRLAYIDWLVPGTDLKVRMGRQLLALPHTALVKNPALWWSDPADGISLSYKINDMFSLSGWWARYDHHWTLETNKANTTDAYALIGNVKFDGFSFTPYVALAVQDSNSMIGFANGFKNGLNPQGFGVYANKTFWFGINGQMNLFDPLVVKADFIYGDRNFTSHADKYGPYGPSQHGWLIDGSVSYKTSFGTPALTAWYGSGDDKDVQYQYQNNLPGLVGRTGISNGFFNGTPMHDNLMVNSDGNCHTPAGTWGVKLGIDGVSFLEDLSHAFAIIYAGGTNDARALNGSAKNPWQYMTEKDHMVEFDFTTTYQIYKNLQAMFAVAYVIEDFETHHNSGSFAGRANDYDNGWGLAMQIQYKF